MERKTIKVYTDGACQNNGKENAKAGVGIYFGKDDPRNISIPLEGKIQTNNRAELTAILMTLEILYRTEILLDKIIIFTDSKYSIDCVTKWIVNWKKNGWVNSSGISVKNKDLISKIDYKLAMFINLELVYVKAHTKGTDENSIGNRAADKLATEGIEY